MHALGGLLRLQVLYQQSECADLVCFLMLDAGRNFGAQPSAIDMAGRKLRVCMTLILLHLRGYESCTVFSCSCSNRGFGL